MADKEGRRRPGKKKYFKNMSGGGGGARVGAEGTVGVHCSTVFF
jgi:hypothetical protein